MKTVITAETLFTPLEEIRNPVVIIEDERIAAVASRAALEIPTQARHLDFPGQIIVPGLIDVHIHGGSGYDVMQAGASALASIEQGMVRHGVTSYLPTTVTASWEQTLHSVDLLGQHIERPPAGHRSRALGIHLEGPFISHAKRGVHPPEHLLPPTPALLQNLHDAARHTVRMMTLAPEVNGAVDTIRHASGLGIRSSLGHSDADLATARAAVDAGALHATHTFNAMRPLDHREPGILGLVLSDDRLTADLIADGIHVAPEVVKVFLASKGLQRSLLITDAISATGMPNGQYQLGNFQVHVKDGRCEYQGRLAGSVLTLDGAVRNVMQFAALTLRHAIQLVTINPARLLGIAHERGAVVPGAVADLTILNPHSQVVGCMVAGTMEA